MHVDTHAKGHPNGTTIASSQCLTSRTPTIKGLNPWCRTSTCSPCVLKWTTKQLYVVLWAPRPPHWECADMDLRQQSNQHLETWPVPFSWSLAIADCLMPQVHRTVRQYCEIMRLTATALPLPPCNHRPLCPSPPSLSEFQSTVLAEYHQLARTLMRHRHWDMALGSRFLQYARHTKASLLQHFYKQVRQCHTTLHTSIAIFCRLIIVLFFLTCDRSSTKRPSRAHCCRIIVWRRQGTFLLDYYDTLMETCDAKKTAFWIQSLLYY